MPLKDNAIFIHIPKTGGQSVSSLLGINKGDRSKFYADELTHLTIQMLDDRMDISGKYIFSFVRNPYDKIISEYGWRMKNRTSVVFNEPTKKLITFDEYMDVLAERWDKMDGEWHTKAHVSPQHKFIDDRVEVFRFEWFESECAKLKKKLGISKAIPHVNRGGKKSKHTKRTIEIVNELYKEDFKTFGYYML